MTLEADVADGLDTFFAQDLATFEPDPESDCFGVIAAAADADAGDPQWIVWADAAEESAWAAAELVWR